MDPQSAPLPAIWGLEGRLTIGGRPIDWVDPEKANQVDTSEESLDPSLRLCKRITCCGVWFAWASIEVAA